MQKRPLLDIPDSVTRSAADFYEQHLAIMLQYSIGEMIIGSHERFVVSAGKALATDGMSPAEVFPEAFAELEALKGYIEETRPSRLEVALSRTVENFLSYVSDILTEAIIARPDLLRTQEQVTLEEVLNHQSIEDFVRWAAERRVSQLSFKGLDEIASYVEKRLGMKLQSSDGDWDTLTQSIAVRNIIVHRRSIADERFLWAMKGETEVKLGEKFQVPREALAQTMKCAMKIVRGFDARVAEKFDILLLSSADQEWYEKVGGAAGD
ncbi:hypothetical protein GCM10010441_51100 [Kitasatospora paracochleata]|uniref:RiboL-PSP-HEPN domain-containing protein n=1 Tax=Kitasatospora paracochleata TaxID=58354 RepID=A0ABT1IS97_9ACTN|nr:hypothetical protein [Kitasatospora paracochleata]MCP2307786.1 hypothetical protein [Kitasatospora paracochleata]